MKNLLSLVAIVMMAPALGHAASFDCSKANTDAERTVCTNPEISRKDDELAAAYRAAIGGLNADAAKVMQQNQRSWLMYLPVVCDGQYLRVYEPQQMATAKADCFKAQYDDRTKLLKTSREINGLRFYSVDTYRALLDKQNGAPQLATHEGSYPLLAAKNDAAARFNAFVMAKAGKPRLETMSDTESMITVGSASGQRISLQHATYFYGHGAAHGISNINYLHYLPAEKREMTTQDIFKNTNWRPPLTAMALRALTGYLKRAPDAMDIGKAVTSPSRWRFTTDGLEIQFGPYEVASYVEGLPIAFISWNELRPYLQKDAMRTLGPLTEVRTPRE